MVMYTGLWQPVNDDYWNTADEQRRLRAPADRGSQRTASSAAIATVNNRNNNNNNNNSPPRTIEYGSVFEHATAEPEDKTVSWSDDYFSNGSNSNMNNGDTGHERKDNDEDNKYENSTSESTGTSATSEQELPSLTGAFQSLENRTIVRNCLLYLGIYMSLAVVAYSYVFEQWTIIDSLYFAVATFTTCGYGDKEPTTTAGQIFTIFFAIYGVIILGVFIAIFGSTLSEAQTKAMKRFQRQKQHQMIETLFKKPGEDSIRQEDHIEQSGFWRDHVSLADDVWKVVTAEFPLIGLVAIMALILGIREDWGITSTLYFCIMAATTTGYGDYTPESQIDKLYCVILLPLAVAVFGEVLGRIASVYIQRKQRLAQRKFVHRSLTLCDLRNMDTNDDGKVDREDFVFFMLVALQKVDKSTIDELKAVFDSLDTNGNGLLEEDDIVELAEENYLPTLEAIQKEYLNSSDLDELLLRDMPEAPVPLPLEIQKHRRAHTVL